MPKSSTNDHPAGRKLVLIVEDHPPTREALYMLLDSQGYQVLQAGNGLEALEVIDAIAEPPSIVLLDLVMPVMDGREFLKARGQDCTLSRIPVVVLSSNARDGESMDGVEACLRKPTSPETLLRLVHRLCERNRDQTPSL